MSFRSPKSPRIFGSTEIVVRWQYRLSSFLGRDTKLQNSFGKTQHTYSNEIIAFCEWIVSAELSKIGHHFRILMLSKNIRAKKYVHFPFDKIKWLQNESRTSSILTKSIKNMVYIVKINLFFIIFVRFDLLFDPFHNNVISSKGRWKNQRPIFNQLYLRNIMCSCKNDVWCNQRSTRYVNRFS